MKKEMTKLSKQEKEQIENKLLAAFATALGSIMILLYLMNWFQGGGGFLMAARILIYVIMGCSLAGTIFLCVKSKSLLKIGKETEATKAKNWSFVTLAATIGAFFVYPTEIIAGLFSLVRLGGVGNSIVMFINKLRFNGNPISSRIVFLIALIAIYIICMFVYYGNIQKQAHKASLNKGAKK